MKLTFIAAAALFACLLLPGLADATPRIVQQQFVQPVYAQPVFAQPIYAAPVVVQQQFVQPVYAQPVFAQQQFYGYGGVQQFNGGFSGGFSPLGFSRSSRSFSLQFNSFRGGGFFRR